MLKSKYLKRVIKICAFILVGILLFQRLSLLVQVYGTDADNADRRDCLFFTLPRGSVDCVFLGSSHVFCSIIPQQIYDDSGITSALLSTSSQSMQNSYYLLKEAFRRQSPKVVVLDMSNIAAAAKTDVLNFRLHFSSGISALPDISYNKVLDYKEMKEMNYGYSNRVTLNDAYGFLEYKSEFDRNEDNFDTIVNLLIHPANEYKTFGYYATSIVYPLESLSTGCETENYYDLYSTVEFDYYLRMKALCEKNNAELIVIQSLYYAPEFDDYHLQEQFIDYLEKEDMVFIDLFNQVDEMGIDLSKDFRDTDHVNILGAQKVTRYLTQYLQEKYSLEDHRGDRRYKLWERRDFDYDARVKEAEQNSLLI